MARRFKTAVIGAGAMGLKHIEAWQGAGHEVAGLADVDRPRAEEVARRYGIPTTHADYRELLATTEAEIVSVCTPLALHAPVTIAAAERGKHVFCEKPLARSFDEADAMEAAVAAAGVRFGIGFQRNLSVATETLVGLAREGRFGHPLLFSSDVMNEVRPKRLMHDRQGNNGPLVDTGCHFYLLWQTVFGSRPKCVYAQGRILAQGRPELASIAELAIDTAVVTVEYESGDLATLTASWGLAAGTKMRGRPDRLVGPRATAERSPEGWRLWEGERVEVVPVPDEDLLRKELALFAGAVEAGEEPPYGLRAGREMLALTLAILRSIETGTVVPVAADE